MSKIKENIEDYFINLDKMYSETLITPSKAAFYAPIIKSKYKKVFDALGTETNQWGLIEGDILDQTDLINYIDSKIPSSLITNNVLIDCGSILSPNENILIDCGTII